MKWNHLQWYVNKIRIPVYLLDVCELCWRVRGWNFTHLSLFFWVENEGKCIFGWITTFSIHVILIHTLITECSVHKEVEHWAINPNISIVPLSHLCVIPVSSQKQHHFPWAASHSPMFASQSLSSGCNFWTGEQTKDLIYICDWCSQWVHF